MDPNDQGQAPGAQTPPPAEPYGAPPASPYGAPPASPYGAPPPEWGVPASPPPEWGVPAPTPVPVRRSPLPRLIGVVGIVIALAIAGFVVTQMNSVQRGKVVFSTDVPKTGTNCKPANQVTSVSPSTAVYATYIFKSTQGSEVVSLEIGKSGQTLIPMTPLPLEDSQSLDCFGDTTDLSGLPGWSAGTYHFSITSNGSVVTEGDLIVK